MSQAALNESTFPQQIWLRKDLSFSQYSESPDSWVLKDPISLNYFYFNTLEKQILCELKSPKTISQLWSDLGDKVPHSLSVDEVEDFVKRLAGDGLVATHIQGDGNRFYNQQARQAIQGTISNALGFLSIRLPGFDPSFILNQFALVGRIVFSRIAIAITFVLVACSVATAVFSIASVGEKLIELTYSFDFFQATLLLAAFIFIKIIHELAHGLCCRTYDGNCTEIGLMFLVFLPVLYCDVSDIWTQPDKRKRIMVSFAGIYAELWIAMVCFWLWFFSGPSIINSLLFSLMIVASLNTLLVNGNPLLRYDGYYLLVDIWNTPNLSARSNAEFGRFVRTIFFRSNEHSFEKKLILYAFFSYLYRQLIMISILGGIYFLFRKAELAWIGFALVMVIFSLNLIPMIKFFGRLPGYLIEGGKRLVFWLFFAGLIATLTYVVCCVEFSYRVSTEATLAIKDPTVIYCSEDGRLFTSVRIGDQVAVGDELGRIESVVIDDSILEIQGKIEVAKERRDNLAILNNYGASREKESNLLESQISSLKNQIADLKRRAAKLVLNAPSSGQIFPVDFSVEPDGQVPYVESGQSVERGMPIFVVGNPYELEGIAVVSEKEIETVEIGSIVNLVLPFESPIQSQVVSISSNSSLLKSEKDPNGPVQDKQFVVKFNIDTRSDFLAAGANLKIVIYGEKTTIAKYTYRVFRSTFMW